MRSRYLAVGYWGDPARTAERFGGDCGGVRRYRSGDLGRRRSDGALELLGRKDLLVKLHGAWVDLGAVEQALLELPGVKDAAVVVREAEGGRTELVAYLVPAGMPPPDPAEWRAGFARRAPQLPAPTRWEWLPALPQDANGKIDRAKLPAPADRLATTDADASDAVGVCWREILGAGAIRRDQPFGEAGGDSFAAIELALLLERRLQAPVPPDLIDALTTLDQLVLRLGQGRGTGCVTLLAEGGAGTPLVLFHGVYGHLVAYQALVRRLAPWRPVYGVRPPRLDLARSPPVTVPWLAARYAAELRPILGHGPCTLAGNCLGGALALETARLLRASGTEVAPAVLIDTALPAGVARRLGAHAAALVAADPERSPSREELPPGRAALALRMLGWLGSKARRQGIWWGWRACRAVGLTPPRWLVNPAMILVHARDSYRPRPQGDRAVLICIGRVTNQRGWERVACGGLETLVLPARGGTPRTDHAIEEPYAEDVARVLHER